MTEEPFPQRIYELLAPAVVARCDVFLTVDENVLALRDQIEQRLKIKVRRPTELVAELKSGPWRGIRAMIDD